MKVYADWAASAPLCEQAKEQMIVAMEWVGNSHSLHSYGEFLEVVVDSCRQKIANRINASPEKIFFTSGATHGNRLVFDSVVQYFKTTYCTEIEHNSILNLCQNRDLTVNIEGVVEPRKLGFGCKWDSMWSIGWINNEIGTVQDIKHLAKMAHIYGHLLHTDATQAIGQIPVDVKDTGIDFLTCSSHKFGGPAGVGFIYCENDMYSMCKPEKYRFEQGTLDVVGIVGMTAALEFSCDNMEQHRKHKKELSRKLIDGILREVPYAELTGHPEKRSDSICSFVIPNGYSHPLVAMLSERGVLASGGSACNSGSYNGSHVLRAVGYLSEQAKCGLRLSIGYSTTENDVDYIIQAVKDCVKELRK